MHIYAQLCTTPNHPLIAIAHLLPAEQLLPAVNLPPALQSPCCLPLCSALTRFCSLRPHPITSFSQNQQQHRMVGVQRTQASLLSVASIESRQHPPVTTFGEGAIPCAVSVQLTFSTAGYLVAKSVLNDHLVNPPIFKAHTPIGVLQCIWVRLLPA